MCFAVMETRSWVNTMPHIHLLSYQPTDSSVQRLFGDLLKSWNQGIKDIDALDLQTSTDLITPL